jgi:DNA polymerase elongation subunit (family B)
MLLNFVNSTSIYDLVMIDIETVPQYSDYMKLPESWKNLWIDKISKTMPENISHEECYVQRAGIMAEFGKIICICIGYFTHNESKELTLRIKSIYGDDEKIILQSFKDVVEKICKHNKNFEFAGHNIREFDIPFICRRFLINEIELPSCLQIHGAKPWEVKMVDTLQWWKFGDYKNYISLNLLANVLNVPTSKTDMDGSMVQHVYYNEKDLRRIAEYCMRDVIVVANVVLRFRNMSLLKDDSIIIAE